MTRAKKSKKNTSNKASYPDPQGSRGGMRGEVSPPVIRLRQDTQDVNEAVATTSTGQAQGGHYAVYGDGIGNLYDGMGRIFLPAHTAEQARALFGLREKLADQSQKMYVLAMRALGAERAVSEMASENSQLKQTQKLSSQSRFAYEMLGKTARTVEQGKTGEIVLHGKKYLVTEPETVQALLKDREQLTGQLQALYKDHAKLSDQFSELSEKFENLSTEAAKHGDKVTQEQFDTIAQERVALNQQMQEMQTKQYEAQKKQLEAERKQAEAEKKQAEAEKKQAKAEQYAKNISTEHNSLLDHHAMQKAMTQNRADETKWFARFSEKLGEELTIFCNYFSYHNVITSESPRLTENKVKRLEERVHNFYNHKEKIEKLYDAACEILSDVTKVDKNLVVEEFKKTAFFTSVIGDDGSDLLADHVSDKEALDKFYNSWKELFQNDPILKQIGGAHPRLGATLKLVTQALKNYNATLPEAEHHIKTGLVVLNGMTTSALKSIPKGTPPEQRQARLVALEKQFQPGSPVLEGLIAKLDSKEAINNAFETLYDTAKRINR